MIRSTLPLVIAALLTVSCGRQPGVYAAPPQRSTDLGTDPDGTLAFVKMDDPQAPEYLVRDISPEAGFRRWAFVYPELRFRVNDASHLTFTAEFAVPAVTFKTTGPVNVTYAVNGTILGTLRCVRAGDYEIHQPVPAGLVEAGKFIRVTFEATPRWVSPDDGAQLSFLLRSAGFIH
ncbi:MAG: hypothetical protein ABI759_28785 [Candidatus Solibacter sp.]